METFETNGTRYRVREKELKQHQTEDNPRVAQMRREFAEHPSSGLTPAKLAVIMTNAEQGDLIQQCYLAEDIEEKDGHIQAELFKRKMALSDVEFNIEPPANASAQEQKDAADIEQMLKDVDGWHDVVFGMADGILKGFSNTELEWEIYQNWRVPTNFQHRPATWFQLNQHDQNQIMLRDQSGKGEALRPLNWLQHRHSAKSGYPARIGLIRQLAWPFIFKNYSLRDLAEFLEIYGIPVRLGKYPSGATDTEKQRLLQAVLSIGHNAGGVIPKGMEIEFHDAAKGGGSDPFMTMMSHCERIQSKVIVGQTLTSQVDSSGSQALGNVHNEVRLDIRDHDLRQIASTLNRDLIWPMYMLNGKSYTGDARRKPRLVFDTQEPEDLSLYADALPKLVGIGVQVPVQYAHDKLRIPMPEANEPVLAVAQTAPSIEPPEEKPKAALKLALAALKAKTPELTDAPEHFTAMLKGEIGESFTGMFQPIQDLVDGAESLEALKEQLLELEAKLDTEAYQEQLGQAFVAAELAGRFDVNQGN
ncbi:DUF935 domain-containing protein [uncultured Paraglaciecola sp.]|uniref:DUF935 domain-containing protein n=1 Tax=uncultured Paraglaciecola sp. TaxID=1765024 RepID=UPI0026391928|nr:DUF935 domain-containing protein [uncultured Paraglaciecola sp.]